MKIAEIKDLTLEEIGSKLDSTRLELVTLRMKMASRQLENSSLIRKSKKLIARLLTVKNQKEKNPDQVEAKSEVVEVKDEVKKKPVKKTTKKETTKKKTVKATKKGKDE